MTLLGPLLMASLILSRYWIEMIPPEPQQIAVVDDKYKVWGLGFEAEGLDCRVQG